MEPLGLGVIFSALTGAIGTLFLWLMKERDKREAAVEAAHKRDIEGYQRDIAERDTTITELRTKVAELEQRVDRQSTIIAENTAALSVAAESQKKVVRLLSDFLTTDKGSA